RYAMRGAGGRLSRPDACLDRAGTPPSAADAADPVAASGRPSTEPGGTDDLPAFPVPADRVGRAAAAGAVGLLAGAHGAGSGWVTASGARHLAGGCNPGIGRRAAGPADLQPG